MYIVDTLNLHIAINFHYLQIKKLAILANNLTIGQSLDMKDKVWMM